jgi:hypothetical protein
MLGVGREHGGGAVGIKGFMTAWVEASAWRIWAKVHTVLYGLHGLLSIGIFMTGRAQSGALLHWMTSRRHLQGYRCHSKF